MNIWFVSPYLITIFIAWFGSHTIKYFINSSKHKKVSLVSTYFKSGGMPSSHSATVASLTMIIGLRDGFGSAIFGLTLLFALIVIYDSFKLRRSSGEQGLAIRSLIKEQNSSVKLPMVTEGHSFKEVLFGIAFGVIIGAVVFLSTV